MVESKYETAELLRKYREHEIKGFQYYRALLDEIESFFYARVEDHTMALDIFCNDSGKWIVVKNYANRGAISKRIIDEFCETYKVTLDHITQEVNIDSDGHESKGTATYLFEIIK